MKKIICLLPICLLISGCLDVKFDKQSHEPGLFNGLLHYAFFKIRTRKMKVDYIKITLKNDEYWCFDGERGDKKTVEIQVLKQEIKVIGKAQK